MLGRIVAGLVVIAMGVGIIVSAHSMVKMFGQIRRAEQNIGSTKDFYVLVGCAIVVVGVLTMFGMIQVGFPATATPAGL